MEKNIKNIIKADLANAGKDFEKDYLLDRDNWISVDIYDGHLEIGDHINGAYLEEAVVVDKNIITSRGPATAMAFAYELLNQLGYNEQCEKIKEGMLYNLYK